MTWILTNSGKHFDYADPQPDQIDILDIAQGLANECRYAGQCRVFYSVAQHSTLASQIVSHEHALEALLHDAAEAYCKDIPRPLKYMLPDYQAIEHRVEAAIRERFRLPADKTPWPVLEGVSPLERKIMAAHAGRAQSLFLKRWVELTRDHH